MRALIFVGVVAILFSASRWFWDGPSSDQKALQDAQWQSNTAASDRHHCDAELALMDALIRNGQHATAQYRQARTRAELYCK